MALGYLSKHLRGDHLLWVISDMESVVEKINSLILVMEDAEKKQNSAGSDESIKIIRRLESYKQKISDRISLAKSLQTMK